jgi:nitroreductase
MTIYEAMQERHSVRRYTDRPIEAEKIAALNKSIEKISAESGLNIELILDEPEAFSGTLAKYGHFSGCTNYICFSAPDGRDEEIGYFGEKLVLEAQMMGFNTCWVVLTYSKNRVPANLREGEKIQVVISIGYGVHNGKPHKNKPMEELCAYEGEMPEWFRLAMEAAMTAPTALNQQAFKFTLIGENKVKAEAENIRYAAMDLGIVKYHFELGAGDFDFEWVE